MGRTPRNSGFIFSNWARAETIFNVYRKDFKGRAFNSFAAIKISQEANPFSLRIGKIRQRYKTLHGAKQSILQPMAGRN